MRGFLRLRRPINRKQPSLLCDRIPRGAAYSVPQRRGLYPRASRLRSPRRTHPTGAAPCDVTTYEDFGKPAEDMKPIEVAPFYVTRTYTPMDVTMGGLMCNEKMQVLHEDGGIIEGLYAIGNTQGGFYGGIDYDLEVDAFSLGRAVTTGRLAAKYACEE